MTDEAQIKELNAKIAKLEGRINVLSEGCTRLAKASREHDEALGRQCDMIQEMVNDAFARIINLELKTFPNLVGDIEKLHGIIGDGDNKATNSLDRRKK